MKHLLSALCRKLAAPVLSEVRQELYSTRMQVARTGQLNLLNTYQDLVRRNVRPLPSFAEVGFRCHSQFEEDGILLYIFALIGTTNRTCVEICAGDGIECNTANLILNHGWWGCLFDGNPANVATGTSFSQASRDTWLHPPVFRQAWITAENVNSLVRAEGLTGEIDLFSLDIDGMDYWVWKALDCIQPRVVVCETLNAAGPGDAVTPPYAPDFKITTPDFHGASLAAMTKLAREKGYRLVGTHRYGFNAFFVRNGIGEDVLPEVTPADCLQDPYSRLAHATRWPKVRDLPWTKV